MKPVRTRLEDAAKSKAPSDYIGQIAAMLAECLNIIDEHRDEHSPEQQEYARPYQLAKRYGYTENGLRGALVKAEESDRVKVLKLKDKLGRGQKLYHIRQFEKYFAGNLG